MVRSLKEQYFFVCISLVDMSDKDISPLADISTKNVSFFWTVPLREIIYLFRLRTSSYLYDFGKITPNFKKECPGPGPVYPIK